MDGSCDLSAHVRKQARLETPCLFRSCAESVNRHVISQIRTTRLGTHTTSFNEFSQEAGTLLWQTRGNLFLWTGTGTYYLLTHLVETVPKFNKCVGEAVASAPGPGFHVDELLANRHRENWRCPPCGTGWVNGEIFRSKTNYWLLVCSTLLRENWVWRVCVCTNQTTCICAATTISFARYAAVPKQTGYSVTFLRMFCNFAQACSRNSALLYVQVVL